MITLFLCGDVMIGRGIDQVLRSSVDPRLFEPSATSAEDYVRPAEAASGPIPRPVVPGYVWGEALAAIDAMRPVARIVNLATAVTTGPAAWPGKDVPYRTHRDTPPSSGQRGSTAASSPTTLDSASGRLVRLSISPFLLRRFRLGRPNSGDVDWLGNTLDRHSHPVGARVSIGSDGKLSVRADGQTATGARTGRRAARSRARPS